MMQHQINFRDNKLTLKPSMSFFFSPSSSANTAFGIRIDVSASLAAMSATRHLMPQRLFMKQFVSKTISLGAVGLASVAVASEIEERTAPRFRKIPAECVTPMRGVSSDTSTG